jgi:uncharacterized protein (TIGR02757 family)
MIDVKRAEELKVYLNKIYLKYHRSFLSPDPLEVVHRFNNPRDREVVGLIASTLAYGRVELILKSIDFIVNRMDNEPYTFLLSYDPYRDGKKFSSFIYRFNSGEDIACLLYFMKQILENFGSIQDFFIAGYREEDRNIKESLQSFVERVLSLDTSPYYRTTSSLQKTGIKFFFPSPKDGSPCKRLNLYLRWMARDDDGLDVGAWEKVSPDKLIIPLDTHIARLSRYLGLTRRRSHDWKMAEEITDGLKMLDPEDPIKYDFALCRLGILKECPNKRDHEKCQKCPIEGICLMK